VGIRGKRGITAEGGCGTNWGLKGEIPDDNIVEQQGIQLRLDTRFFGHRGH